MYLYRDLIDFIFTHKGNHKLSLNLGLTYEQYNVDELQQKLLPIKDKIKGRAIYLYKDDRLIRLSVFHNHYFSLVMVNNYPILEIDGIRMHVFYYKSPFKYAQAVVKHMNISKKDYVLETCFGQGYITRLLRTNVVAYEKNKGVLEIAKLNPYSSYLFNKENVHIVNEDIFNLKQYGFTKIIHDPPSIRVAPELYSPEFYKLLFKHSAKHTLLYHYIGNTYKKRFNTFKERIIENLFKSGWRLLTYNHKLKALFLKKP